MKIKILQLLEALFGRIAEIARDLRERCAICLDCGGNRYTSPPCKNNGE